MPVDLAYVPLDARSPKNQASDITWHVMSLAVLNERRLEQLTPQNRELMGKAWAPVRVLKAAKETFGSGVLEPLYTALGTQYFLLDQPETLTTIRPALREAGLPQHLAEVGDTTRNDRILRCSHRKGIDLVGQEVESPIIAIPESSAGARKSRTCSQSPRRVIWPRVFGTTFLQSWQSRASTRSSGPALSTRSSTSRTFEHVPKRDLGQEDCRHGVFR
jgi:Mycothiol-dependent nitroreductase Rv2466c